MRFGVGWKCTIVAVGLALSGGVARADVEYTYTGAPFDEFKTGVGTQQFTSSDNISMTLGFNAPLAPNTLYAFGSPVVEGLQWLGISLVAFNFSDGVHNNSGIFPAGLLTSFLLDTDNSGGISQWNITLENFFAFYIITSSSSGDSSVVDESQSQDFGITLEYSASSPPGTWSGPVDVSTTSVPEPASLTIFAIGLGALAWTRRRRGVA